MPTREPGFRACQHSCALAFSRVKVIVTPTATGGNPVALIACVPATLHSFIPFRYIHSISPTRKHSDNSARLSLCFCSCQHSAGSTAIAQAAESAMWLFRHSRVKSLHIIFCTAFLSAAAPRPLAAFTCCGVNSIVSIPCCAAINWTTPITAPVL